MNDQELMKFSLNQTLNADFLPPKEYIHILGNYSFLGYKQMKGLNLKCGVFDWDGVMEKKGTKKAYILLHEPIHKLDNAWDDINSIISSIEQTGNIPSASQKFFKLYQTHNVLKKDIDNAIIEAEKNFEFVPDAKEFSYRFRNELGNEPAVISGSLKDLLDRLAAKIEFPRNNVIATKYHYDSNGNIVRIEFVLNEFKRPGMDRILQTKVNSEYGCCYIFSNDPVADASMAKCGNNPSFFVEKIEGMKLDFDVTTTVPEARERMCSLIPKMYRFDYGWIVYNTRKPSEQRELMERIGEIKIPSSDLLKKKQIILRNGQRILHINERMLDDLGKFKQLYLNVLYSADEDDVKNSVGEMIEYMSTYIPEFSFEFHV